MIVALALAALGVVALCVVVIEKKRGDGPLTYPLWQGSLFVPWSLFAVLSLLIIGGINLPRYNTLFGIHRFTAQVQGTVTRLEEAHCKVDYSYSSPASGRFKTPAAECTGTDSACDLKQGDKHAVYYNEASPCDSILYAPEGAIINELIALALVVLCFPTLLVLWFRATHIIGKRKTS